MRTRSRVDYSNLVTARYVTQNGVNIDTSYTSQGGKVIRDTDSPGYWDIVKKGGILPFRTMDVKTTNDDRTSAYLVVRNSPTSVAQGTIFRNTTEILSAVIPIPGYDSGAISSVVNQAIASSKSEVLDGLTFFAELNKTTSMVANRMNSIFKIADTVAHAAKGKSFGQRVSSFNNLWLEYRYGWRPLIADMNNIVKQFGGKERVQNSGASSITIPISSNEEKILTLPANLVRSVRVVEGQQIYRGSALSTGVFGTTPTFQPITTAWELVPYSFVIDWFMDIGSWLQAVNPVPGVDTPVSGYSVHTTFTCNVKDYTEKNPASSWNVESTYPGNWTYKVDLYDRKPSGVQAPRFYPNLNTLRAIDLASLVFQRSGRVLSILSKR